MCGNDLELIMEVILATSFSQDISLGEIPLTRAAASIVASQTPGSSVVMERLIMILSHFPWSVPFLRF